MRASVPRRQPRVIARCQKNKKEGSTLRSLMSGNGRWPSPHLSTIAPSPFRLRRGLASRARCAGQSCQFPPTSPREVRVLHGRTSLASSSSRSVRCTNWLAKASSLESKVSSTILISINFTLIRRSSSVCSVACVTICAPNLSTLNLHPSTIK